MVLRKAVAFVLVGVAALALWAAPAPAAERKVELEVVGLLCGKDTYTVSAIFDEVSGIRDYELDISDQTAVVTFDDESTSVDAIGKALDRDGYGINRITFLAD